MADERVALFQKHLKEGKTIEEAKKLALGAEIKTEANVMGVKATPATLSTALSGQAPIQGIESKMNPYMTTKPAPLPARPETIKEVAQRRSGAPRAQTMQEIAGPKATPTIGMRTGEDPEAKKRSISEQAQRDTYNAPISQYAGQVGGEALLNVGEGGLSLARGVSEMFGATDTARSLGETQKALSQTKEQFAQRGEGVRKAAQNLADTNTDWGTALQGTALKGIGAVGGVSNALSATAQFAGQGLGNTASAVSGLYGGGQQAGETKEMLGQAITGGKEALAQQAGKATGNLTTGDIVGGIAKAGLKGASNVGKTLQDENQSLKANEMVGNVIGSAMPVGAIGKFNEVVDPINILSKGAKAGYQGAQQGAKLLGKAGSAVAEATPGALKVGASQIKSALKAGGQALDTASRKTSALGATVLGSPLKLAGKVLGEDGTVAGNLSTRWNRLKPNAEKQFFEQQGKSVGEFLTEKGIHTAGENTLEKVGDMFQQSMAEADTGLEAIKGTFKHPEGKHDYVKVALDQLEQMGKDTLDTNLEAKIAGLSQKYADNGLTMTELNDLKREFQRNNKFGYLQEAVSPEKVQRSTNILDGIRKFQMETAEANGFTNLREINKNTQAYKAIEKGLADKLHSQAGNNLMSLTDWIVATGSPAGFPALVAKKLLSTDTAKGYGIALANMGKKAKGALETADVDKIKKTQAFNSNLPKDDILYNGGAQRPLSDVLVGEQLAKKADTPGAIRTKEDLDEILKSSLPEETKVRLAKDWNANQKGLLGVDPETGAPLRPISGERQTILRPKSKVTQATQAPGEVKALGSPAMNARYYKGLDLSNETAVRTKLWGLPNSAPERYAIENAVTKYKNLSNQENARKVMGELAQKLSPKMKQEAIQILSRPINITKGELKAELKSNLQSRVQKGKDFLNLSKKLNAPKSEGQLVDVIAKKHGVTPEEATDWLHDNLDDLVKMPEKELIDEFGLDKKGILQIQKEMYEGKGSVRAEKQRVTLRENKIRAEAKTKGVEQPLTKPAAKTEVPKPKETPKAEQPLKVESKEQPLKAEKVEIGPLTVKKKEESSLEREALKHKDMESFIDSQTGGKFGKVKAIDLTAPKEDHYVSRFADEFEKKKHNIYDMTYGTLEKIRLLDSALRGKGFKGVTPGDFKGRYSLDKIIDNKALFEKYPQLKEINVMFVDFHTPTQRGVNTGSEIFLNSKLYNKDKTNIESTLVHEIEHSIQDIKGTKKFSNFEEGRSMTAKEYGADIREQEARKRQQDYKDHTKTRSQLEEIYKKAHKQPTK